MQCVRNICVLQLQSMPGAKSYIWFKKIIRKAGWKNLRNSFFFIYKPHITVQQNGRETSSSILNNIQDFRTDFILAAILDYKYRLQQQQKLMTITLYGPVLHIIQKFKVQHRYNWCFHKTNYSDKLNITCNTLINFLRHKRSSTLQSESRSNLLSKIN